LNLKRSIKGWWTVLVIFLISILMQGCDKKPDYTHIVVDRMLRSEEIPFVVGVFGRGKEISGYIMPSPRKIVMFRCSCYLVCMYQETLSGLRIYFYNLKKGED